MKLARWGLLALVAMAMPAHAEGNKDAGRIKANTCMGCHGIPKYNNVYPTYRVPEIGGQSEAYLAAALKAYKNGDRPHMTMRAQAASLSDQDIADIAKFFAHAPAHK